MMCVCSWELLIIQVTSLTSVSQTRLRLRWSWPATAHDALPHPFGRQLITWATLVFAVAVCATSVYCPRSLTCTGAQPALVPSGPLDTHALRGESTLIDPTCHAEAMANFSTACIWNLGDGELTWFNNSLWRRRLARDNNVSDTFEGETSQRATRGKTNKPLSLL